MWGRVHFGHRQLSECCVGTEGLWQKDRSLPEEKGLHPECGNTHRGTPPGAPQRPPPPPTPSPAQGTVPPRLHSSRAGFLPSEPCFCQGKGWLRSAGRAGCKKRGSELRGVGMVQQSGSQQLRWGLSFLFQGELCGLEPAGESSFGGSQKHLLSLVPRTSVWICNLGPRKQHGPTAGGHGG